MNLAYEKGGETDILATNILFNIHLYHDSLLDDLFSTEEVFYQSWTNSTLESSSVMKPDWLNYIRPWHLKIDITSCEAPVKARKW
ncbi:hypothetical protein BC941DRAFT_474936 [Chlamydoabsidia padenii]|nr:hypothetical protein BC941DRAFT_474936 [Chlamydoabsidia padenii]